MKFAVVFVFVALATIVYAVPRPDGETYTTKWDNINLDKILNNPRLMDNYMACVFDNGKCTPEGEELKKNMKEALNTCCEKCSDKQKEGVKKVWNHFKNEKPEKFKELKEKYDPEGTKEEECKKKLGW